MYEYELQQMRAAELIRRADQERLARQAVHGRRAARREEAARSAENEPRTHRPRRFRFARAT